MGTCKCGGKCRIFNIQNLNVSDADFTTLTPQQCQDIYDCIINNGTTQQFENFWTALCQLQPVLFNTHANGDGTIDGATTGPVPVRCGDDLLIWSPNDSMVVGLTAGSSIYSLQVDETWLENFITANVPTPASAITDVDLTLDPSSDDDTFILNLSVGYIDDNGNTQTTTDSTPVTMQIPQQVKTVAVGCIGIGGIENALDGTRRGTTNVWDLPNGTVVDLGAVGNLDAFGVLHIVVGTQTVTFPAPVSNVVLRLNDLDVPNEWVANFQADGVAVTPTLGTGAVANPSGPGRFATTPNNGTGEFLFPGPLTELTYDINATAGVRFVGVESDPDQAPVYVCQDSDGNEEVRLRISDAVTTADVVPCDVVVDQLPPEALVDTSGTVTSNNLTVINTTNGVAVPIGEEYILFPNGDTWASPPASAGGADPASTEEGNLAIVGDDGEEFSLPLRDKLCLLEPVQIGNNGNTRNVGPAFAGLTVSTTIGASQFSGSGQADTLISVQATIDNTGSGSLIVTNETTGESSTTSDESWAGTFSSLTGVVFTLEHPLAISVGDLLTVETVGGGGRWRYNFNGTPGHMFQGDTGAGTITNSMAGHMDGTLKHTVRVYSDGETEKVIEFDANGDPQEITIDPSWTNCDGLMSAGLTAQDILDVVDLLFTKNVECFIDNLGVDQIEVVDNGGIPIADSAFVWTADEDGLAQDVRIRFDEVNSPPTLSYTVTLTILEDGNPHSVLTAQVRGGGFAEANFGQFQFQFGSTYTFMATTDAPNVNMFGTSSPASTFPAPQATWVTDPGDGSLPMVEIVAPGSQRYSVRTDADGNVSACDENGNDVPIDPTWLRCDDVLSPDQFAIASTIPPSTTTTCCVLDWDNLHQNVEPTGTALIAAGEPGSISFQANVNLHTPGSAIGSTESAEGVVIALDGKSYPIRISGTRLHDDNEGTLAVNVNGGVSIVDRGGFDVTWEILPDIYGNVAPVSWKASLASFGAERYTADSAQGGTPIDWYSNGAATDPFSWGGANNATRTVAYFNRQSVTFRLDGANNVGAGVSWVITEGPSNKFVPVCEIVEGIQTALASDDDAVTATPYAAITGYDNDGGFDSTNGTLHVATGASNGSVSDPQALPIADTVNLANGTPLSIIALGGATVSAGQDQITVPTAGLYEVHLSVTILEFGAGNHAMQLVKNVGQGAPNEEVIHASGDNTEAADEFANVSFTLPVQLDAGDTLSLGHLSDSGAGWRIKAISFSAELKA